LKYLGAVAHKSVVKLFRDYRMETRLISVVDKAISESQTDLDAINSHDASLADKDMAEHRQTAVSNLKEL